MTSAGIAVIIPARMRSSRFPGKPLVPIAGLPMVEHVRRRALLEPSVEVVYVATCDPEIRDAVEAFGGRVLMTSPAHVRGTDRVEEAARAIDTEIIVNVQGDEPLLLPEVIAAAAAPLRSSEIVCTNLLSPLRGPHDLADPDIVKATVDRQGFILSFARCMRPYTQLGEDYPVYRQTGIYAFRKTFLHRYAALPPTPLERVESVDMWRVLEHGYHILGVVATAPTLGVDQPADVERIEALLRSDAAQRLLFEAIAS